MKYELLKRTAIALFVGSVVSTYSVAESGKISAKSSFDDIANAVNKNDENISKIKTDVSDLAKSLKGDDQNPGLLDALEEASKGIDENKKALDKKADKEDVDAIDTEVGVIGKNVKTIGEDLDITIKDVESLQGDMKKASEAVNSLSDNLKELNDAQNTLNESFKDQLNAANEALDKHESDIKEIKNLKGYDSLTKVEALVSGKADKQALEDLKKEVKDNEEGIGELSKTVSDIDDNVVKLTDAHNELLKEHNNLVEDVKGFNDAYNKFTDATNTELDKKADIDDVEDALSRKANASDVYTKTESDSKLDAKADKTELVAKADKTELAAKADKTELANKADKNSVYSKSETDNKFALKADNSVVSAQATDINNLRTDVNAHTKRLDHLDNRVNKLDKDLKRGLAAQAALTGLFQPYTVGKANFTAAVGGYKSQTAVAVGTGYRYNQNIATKAGVAFTQGGGVTYNAGVNFEW